MLIMVCCCCRIPGNEWKHHQRWAVADRLWLRRRCSYKKHMQMGPIASKLTNRHCSDKYSANTKPKNSDANTWKRPHDKFAAQQDCSDDDGWRCCLLFIASITTSCGSLDQLHVSQSGCVCASVPFDLPFFLFLMAENLILICLHVLDLHVFFYCVGVFIFLQDKFEFHLLEMGGNQQTELGTQIANWRQDQDRNACSDHQGGSGFGSVWSLWTPKIQTHVKLMLTGVI